jgi:dTMP kinase
LLRDDGIPVHLTAEPSSGQIGELARNLTDDVRGLALACLYAADRYHHIDTEIRPALNDGITVISDRYVLAGLVMQQYDGIDLGYLQQLNARTQRPDIAVVLDADPRVVAGRLTARGPRNRFQRTPSSSYLECHLYQQAVQEMRRAGFTVLQVDCTNRTPKEAAVEIKMRLDAEHCLASTSELRAGNDGRA